MSLYLFLTLLLVFDVKISFQEDIENLRKKIVWLKKSNQVRENHVNFRLFFQIKYFTDVRYSKVKMEILGVQLKWIL